MNKHTEAIMFFNTQGICKEMIMPEFEAILDGVVCMDELKGQTVRCAYVLIDTHLHVTAIVLFLLDFDQDGMADRSWNIPFKQILSSAKQGPYLGTGTTRLVTQTLCSNKTYSSNLWDQSSNNAMNELTLIKEAAKRNRLRLSTQKTSVKENTIQRVESNEILHDNSLLKSQQQVNQLKKQFNDELSRFKQALLEAKQTNEDLINKNNALTIQLETQKQQSQEKYDYLTQLLKNTERKNRAELSIMQRQLEMRRTTQRYRDIAL
ncbi:hypothetical protein [Zooshikella harenae]|uniref:Phage tail tape measure protein n=1 Tax=Zooshikella harenae TaxID=2827238 RepID=A0ABS5Z8X5_9GAMM|nr:hypothetical protein [Zooshikella harenae]MBU2710498.1 phage tail tape measure protein [Zooshikella harenae]